MGDGKDGHDNQDQELPRVTPYLTPKTLDLIKESEEFNKRVVKLTAGTGIGKGVGQQADLKIGPETAPVPTPTLMDTRALSAIENVLVQIDERLRLLSGVLNAVFSDVRRADKERKDRLNLVIAAVSLVIVGITGVAGVVVGIYYGHETVMSGNVADDHAGKQAAAQLAITQKLVDSQAVEISLIQDQLTALRRLNELKASPPKSPSAVRQPVGKKHAPSAAAAK